MRIDTRSVNAVIGTRRACEFMSFRRKLVSKRFVFATSITTLGYEILIKLVGLLRGPVVSERSWVRSQGSSSESLRVRLKHFRYMYLINALGVLRDTNEYRELYKKNTRHENISASFAAE